MGTYVIIGAGAIGPAVARQLVNAGHQVRVVSRRGLGPSHPNIELVAADASDAEQLSSVAKGATAIFNCANPAYHRWSTDWPPIASALLHAAEVTDADLVTLSNLYVYGHVTAPMSPGDPMNATYDKAQVRATMWRDAQRANDEGRVRATEVRASDFIGPNAQGMVGERVMARLLKGRSCQVIGDVEAAHSWSYTEDVARTLVCAAQSDESWGRVWHAVTNAPRSSRQVIDDLADAIRDGIDPRFTLSRYGESLASSAPTFDPIADALAAEPTMIDEMLDAITVELLTKHRPDVVGLTAPFPGNVYGAFRIAQATKAFAPHTRVVLGGGYVNTELRSLSEPRVFDFVDFITLDDGERPMLALLEHLNDSSRTLFRTFIRDEHGNVVLRSDPTHHDIPHRDTGTPTYDGLPLDRYLSLFEMLNPMHRLWSDGRWNKLTVAHGCYWKKCSFCDVTLDYIGRYDPASADILVDRIEAMIAETGQTGFHLVDEAAPPSALSALAQRLIERNVEITWWGNVRFEKAFTPELAQLLARAGCVAISGGLEVASDRLLTLMNKGVTVAQVARVTRAFTDAGIMVHAYLMYGFPTETVQDTVDALEMVRQLFVAGCIQSAFWHRFAATAHSPIGKQPELFGIRLRNEPVVTFARNEVAFDDPTGVDHDELGEGLRRALYNYMHGVGLQENVTSWFRAKRGVAKRTRVPASLVADDLIAQSLVGAV